MWCLKISSEADQSRVGEYHDVNIEAAQSRGSAAFLGDLLVGSLIAYEKGERIGVLACDYEGSLEFLPTGISVTGNPITEILDEHQARNLVKQEYPETWEITFSRLG